MWLGAAAVWICGAGPLPQRIREGLSQGGRSARLVSPGRVARLDPGDCETLVLIEGPDVLELVRGLQVRLSGRRRRGEPLRLILVHAADPPPPLPPGLGALDPKAPLRLETFALEDRAARALLARWPLHLGLDPPFGQRPHLLILGFAPPARALLLQALRLIHYGEGRAWVTVACADPSALGAEIAARYPQAGQVAEIRCITLDPIDLSPFPPVTQVLVCLDPAEPGLALVRHLAQRLAQAQGVSPPILLEIGDARPRGSPDGWDGQIFPFSYLREACRPQVLLDGEGDDLARTIHEHYRDSIAAQGRDPGTEPAGAPWSRLAGTYREANRRQADHIGAKLAVTDCRAVPEEQVESFAFTPLETERLAVIEHQRWAADRHLDGWAYAPERDNARKLHPQLVPYAGLSGPMRDLDRYAVRGVPALLARSGLGVVRILILGVPESAAHCPAGRRLRRLADQALVRLLARYPDRSLVIASTLAGPGARLVVRRALERAGAGLFLLLPRPIGELLAGQPDAESRRDLLALVARAERRISLDGEPELGRWLVERAEILLTLGSESAPVGAHKRIRLDPDRRGPGWSFEY